MKKETDVLVVGGGPVGLYFAGLLAGQGLKVLVCEKDKEEGLGNQYTIIHIFEEAFARYGLYTPVEGDEEYVRSFTTSTIRSSLNNFPKKQETPPIIVLKRPQFIKRIARAAVANGAEILYSTSFKSPIFDENRKIIGGRFKGPKGELEVKARLVADASGIPSVVRSGLPEDYGIENFKITGEDSFYVLLHYIKLKNPEQDRITVNKTWVHYKAWLAPSLDEGMAIAGIGANLSVDYASRCYERFKALGYLPDHEFDRLEVGGTPYRRPPYTFVADNFIALGSAAAISNPWTGEGVIFGWMLSKIGGEVIASVLKEKKYPSQDDLWEINYRYYQENGAEFAKNLAMLAGATDCNEKENDYEFEKSIIYEDVDDPNKGKGLMIKLIKGVLAGKLRLTTVLKLIDAAGKGGKIYRHYKKYPSARDGFTKWKKKADRLWSKTSSMAERAKADYGKMLRSEG